MLWAKQKGKVKRGMGLWLPEGNQMLSWFENYDLVMGVTNVEGTEGVPRNGGRK